MEVSKNVIMILNEIAMSKSKCMDWTMVKEEGPPHARKFTWSLKMGEFETTGVGGITTLQSIMNAKVSQHRFWHCHESRLIKTIETLPPQPK